MQSVPSASVDPPNIQSQKPTVSPQPEGSNENVLNKGSSTAATPVGTIESWINKQLRLHWLKS
jgi:hypothetical protein